jgi:Resolvase, N terminal domain
MRHAVAYCRTACAKQSNPLSGVRLQAKEIRSYAKGRGLAIKRTHSDAGVSGITLERPELQNLIADCRKGKIGTVITKDPDRLSRDTGQLLALLAIFAEMGVAVEFTAPEGRDHCRFLYVLVSAVAEVDKARSPSPPKAELGAPSYVPHGQYFRVFPLGYLVTPLEVFHHLRAMRTAQLHEVVVTVIHNVDHERLHFFIANLVRRVQVFHARVAEAVMRHLLC